MRAPSSPAAGATTSGFAAPRPARGAALACLAIATAALAGTLAWMALRDPAVPFLPGAAPAHWIVFPSAPSPFVRPAAGVTTTFRRAVTLPAGAYLARLRVRARTAGVVRVNGVPVPLAPAGPDWKREREADVTRLVHPGPDTIEVAVTCAQGPPALWLALETGVGTVVSDSSWDATCAGSAVRHARDAALPMRAWARSTPATAAGALDDDRLNPRPVDALRANAARIAGCAALALALALAAAALARRRAGLLRGRWAAAALALAVLAQAAFVLRGGADALAIGFDAPGHVAYVNHLLRTGRMPFADQGWEMYQPPLWYALVAAEVRLAGGAALDGRTAFVVRWVGALALALQTVSLALGLRLLLPGRPRAVFAGTLVALVLPMSLALFPCATNEGLASALTALSLWLALRVVRGGRERVRDHAALGFVLGAALLAKASALLGCVAVLAVLLGRLAWRRERAATAWARGPGVAVALALLVAGGWYGRVWARFGHPLVWNNDPASGFAWWQDPGVHVGADYTRFGAAMVRPLLSGLNGVPDALYSTFWADGMLGGSGRVDVRPAWDVGLASAGLLLALLPTLALAIGAVRALARWRRASDAGGTLALGMLAGTLGSLVALTLRFPFFAQAKMVYASPALLPLLAAIGLGMDTLAAIARRWAPLVWAALGTWALVAALAFAPRGGAALLDAREPSTTAWRAIDASSPAGLDSLERAVARASDAPDALATLAAAYLGHGDVAAAAGAARDALALDPWGAGAHATLGEALRAGGAADEAREQLELAARLGPR